MKIRLTVFLLCFPLLTLLNAQQPAPPCGLSPASDQALMQRLRLNKETLLENPATSAFAATYIPVVFHLVRKTDGAGGARPVDVLAQVCAMNQFFSAQGTNIQFLLQEINEINSFQAYFLHFDPEGEQLMIDNKREGVINVFMLGDANSDSQTSGVTLAYYSSEFDWIVIRKDEINETSETLVHELGHYLSLPHPFRGWDFEPYDPNVHGEQVSDFSPSTNYPSSIANEWQDGSNCETAGDEICDTPPDYNHAAFDWLCNYMGGAKDPGGTLIDPNEKNIMGYFISCVGKEFTEQQKALMGADLFNRVLEGSIERGTSADGGILSGVPQLEVPSDEGNRNNYEAIQFDWEKIDNIQGYVFQVDDSPSFAFGTLERFTKGSSYLLEAGDYFEPNKRYYWRVKAFNANSVCESWSTPFSFTTGLSTAVEEPVLTANWQLQPNPVSAGTSFFLQLDSPEAAEGLLQIYDITGRQIGASQRLAVSAGAQHLPISLGDLSSGLYLLKVQLGTTIWQEQLVVH